MKNSNLLLFFIFLLFGCAQNKPVPEAKVLMDTDRNFSDFSLKNGFHKAFIAFADDSVVILKPDHLPVEGKSNLIKSYEGKSDSSLVLIWEPTNGIISQSGDLGYTYGIWTFVTQKDTSHGTYLTVWKKDSSGQWKFIADTGNDGLVNK